MKTETVLWLLPVVFMIHDFEEIIMVRPWLARNAGEVRRRWPGLAARALPHVEGLSTSAFALAVAEEFIVLSGLTLAAVELGLYDFWAGLLLAFCIHLLVHLAQFAVYGRYVPVIVTSLLAGLYCPVALSILAGRHLLAWPAVAAWTAVALLALVANLAAVHWAAARFDRWLDGRFASR